MSGFLKYMAIVIIAFVAYMSIYYYSQGALP